MIYLIFREYFSPLFLFLSLMDVWPTTASQRAKRAISVFHGSLNSNSCKIFEPGFFRIPLRPSIKLDNFKLVVQRVLTIYNKTRHSLLGHAI